MSLSLSTWSPPLDRQTDFFALPEPDAAAPAAPQADEVAPAPGPMPAATAAPAPAPAPASPATVYGSVNLGLGYDTSQDTSAFKTSNNAFANSLGVRGQHELSDTTKLSFQVEMRADSTMKFEPYTTTVSVKHETFGELKAGRQDSPFRTVPPDAFGGDTVGGRGDRGAGARDRYAQGLVYTSPAFNGVVVSAGVGLPETPEADVAASTSVTYTNPSGSWKVAAGAAHRANGDNAVVVGVTHKPSDTLQLMAAAAHSDGRATHAPRSTLTGGAVFQATEELSLRAKINFDDNNGTATRHAGLGAWYQASKDVMLYADAGVQKTDRQPFAMALDVGVRIQF